MSGADNFRLRAEKETAMVARKWLAVVVAGLVLSGAALAAEAGAADFAKGKALLAKADFAGALEAFKAASKAAPDNQEYFQQAAMVKRVMNLREQFAKEEDGETWQKMGTSLYGFYMQNRLYGEALPVAEKLNGKLATGETAEMLGAVQLAQDKNAEAAELLGKLPADKQTPLTGVLRGVALGRLGKADEAQAIAAKLELPKDCGPELCYEAARLYALTGASDKAIATLVCAFECTPPNWLADVKAEAKDCKEFAKLVSSEAFTKAMATESKVKACGSGKSCGGCPSAAKCAGAAGEKKDAGCTGHEKEAGKEPEKK